MQRQYTFTIRLKKYTWIWIRSVAFVLRDDFFVMDKFINAENRAEAVLKAIRWFRKRIKGPEFIANDMLVVDDPYDEVRYDLTFDCRDLRNKFLPDEVIERVIAESHGKLVRDTCSSNTLGHPICSLRRKKRRRKRGPKAIAPCVYQNTSGTLFYRITSVPQQKRNGLLFKKRKICLIRLEQRTIVGAVQEIELRKLFDRHCSLRRIKKRSIDFLKRIANVRHHL